MKKLSVIILASILTLSLTSCSKDDDGTSTSEQGSWKLVDRQEVGDDQSSTTLDCEKKTVYKFSGDTVEATIYDAKEDNSGCEEPIKSLVTYKIVNDKFITFFDKDGKEIKTGVNVEIFVVADDLKLTYRDPNDSPSSALKIEFFVKQ